ncbi:MAG: 3-phosphoshikimate 1-carboxyvinyltransferase [Alphaproteobacteria bacterium]|nr:MAG: 3-phosphoshikimate 1-carboxyvinyltransferase [Alphaproteobacteria bacterium]
MTGLVSKPASSLKGTARVPGDKSISHRSLMFGALAEGVTTVTGLLEGEDVLRTAAALTAMGAAIETPAATGVWRIRGLGAAPLTSPRATVYLGNSGTSARLLMGLAGGYPLQAVFTGDDSLSRRPMGRVIKPLSQMGVRFETSDGDRMPLKIIGADNLTPIEYTLPVASAQVKSAILLAGLHARGNTVVTEPSPTRDHTERMLRFLGADITSVTQNDGSNVITLKGFPKLVARDFTVPSDPSSAAFLTVAALITKDSDVLIPNVSVNPLRAGIYETLREMGGDITFENPREASGEPVADIRVRSSALKGITVPPARVPSMIDEFPVLSVAASFAEGKTYMSDLAELRVKESDRLAAIARGLAQTGVKAEMGEDTLTVHGGQTPQGGCTIAANLDHRIAMSFLIMGLAAKEPVAIDDSETIGTSFPGFAGLMNALGAGIGPA